MLFDHYHIEIEQEFGGNKVNKVSSIIVADLEALTCVKETKTVVIDAGKK